MLPSLRAPFTADKTHMGSKSLIGFDLSADSVQTLTMPGGIHRSEGIAYSASGNIIAIATSL